MYIPRHWHWAGPTSMILIGFFIHENVNPAWDVIVFVNVPLAVLAMEWGAYIWQAGVAYQMYVTRGAAPAKAEPETPAADPTFVPIVRPIIHDNAQVVAPVKINEEQKVARTLINQRNHNLKVDLTETFWIKRGNFNGSREQFVEMKDKWIRHGVIYKTSERKNAPHDVKDWRAIRLIADGNILPD